jgi:hypothetical protein
VSDLQLAIATILMFASIAGAIGLGMVAWRRQAAIKTLDARQAAGIGMSAPVASDRGMALRGRHTTSQGDLPRPSGSGSRAGIITAFIAVLLIGGFAGWWFVLRGGGSGGTQAAQSQSANGPLGPDPAAAVPADPPAIQDKAAYTVAVLNASGVTGAAGTTVGPKVETAGYRLGKVGDATTQDAMTSSVMWAPGKQAVAQNVAKDLGITQAPPLDGISDAKIGDADVVVVVGKDLAAAP